MTVHTLIIGGGVSGLHVAHLLHEQGISFCLLDGRDDFGGRIKSISRGNAYFELGPSWFWPDTNPRVARFVEKFELPHFTQHTKGEILIDNGTTLRREHHQAIDPRSSHRLTNGSRSLIDAHLSQLPAEQLFTSHRVTKISRNKDAIITTAITPEGEKTFSTQNIVLALPLRLLESSIAFSPALPEIISNQFRKTSRRAARPHQTVQYKPD